MYFRGKGFIQCGGTAEAECAEDSDFAPSRANQPLGAGKREMRCVTEEAMHWETGAKPEADPLWTYSVRQLKLVTSRVLSLSL